MVSPFLSHLFLNLIKSYFVKEEKKNSLRNCLYYSPEFVSFNFKSHFPGDWNRNNKKNSSTCKMHRRGSDRSMREKKKKKKRERKRERERERFFRPFTKRDARCRELARRTLPAVISSSTVHVSP